MSMRIVYIVLGGFLAAWLALAPATAAGPSRARPVALVTDLQGTASRDAGGALSILAELPAGSRVSLAGDGRVRIMMLADSRQFDLLGPGAFTIQADGPQAGGGGRVTPGPALASALRDLRLRPARIAQASLALRGDPLTRPLELTWPVGLRLLEPPGHFAWNPAPGATGYNFQLLDGNGRLLHETATAAPRVDAPADLRLDPGGFYAWRVRARLDGGGEASAWAEFGLADAELRQRVEETRASTGADVSDRLLLALFLDQQGLKDEARRVWQELARERPDALRLRALAAER